MGLYLYVFVMVMVQLVMYGDCMNLPSKEYLSSASKRVRFVVEYQCLPSKMLALHGCQFFGFL